MEGRQQGKVRWVVSKVGVLPAVCFSSKRMKSRLQDKITRFKEELTFIRCLWNNTIRLHGIALLFAVILHATTCGL